MAFKLSLGLHVIPAPEPAPAMGESTASTCLPCSSHCAIPSTTLRISSLQRKTKLPNFRRVTVWPDMNPLADQQEHQLCITPSFSTGSSCLPHGEQRLDHERFGPAKNPTQGKLDRCSLVQRRSCP